MHRRILTGERLIAVFLGGCVLFNYPVLSLFDRGAAVFGIPVVYAYVFTAWAGLIGVMALVIERRIE
jgi:hypothetical protein